MTMEMNVELSKQVSEFFIRRLEDRRMQAHYKKTVQSTVLDMIRVKQNMDKI